MSSSLKGQKTTSIDSQLNLTADRQRYGFRPHWA